MNGKQAHAVTPPPIKTEESDTDHVLDRLLSPEQGLAYEGGGYDRDRPQDIAARMREAWALRDQISVISDQIKEKCIQRNGKPRRAWPNACV